MVDCDDRKKLFVGGISRETSEDTLKDHFAKYGAVVETIVSRDKYTRTHRGFGFVSFSDSSSFHKALQDTHVILEREIEVKPAMPRQNQQQHWDNGSNGRGSTKKIFVGGLAHSLTSEDFKDYFEKFGRINDAVVMYDKNTGRPRGFGFITFDSEDAVENVLQNSFHELGGKLVEVKRSEPREVNNNGDARYVVREGNRRNNFNIYQCYHCDNYFPYSPSCVVFPGYGPISGYGGAAGYPYAANYYGGGFLVGGYGDFGYGMAPPVIGDRGGLMPYSNAACIYPAYMNGAGGMGMAVNGYNGIVEVIENGKSSPSGTHHSQKGTNSAYTQVNGVSVDENSGREVENCSATLLEENGESSHLGSNEVQKLTDIKHAQVNGETVNENSGGMDGSCGAVSLGDNGKPSQLGTNDGQKVADGRSVDENSGGEVENCSVTSVGENGGSSHLGCNEAQKLTDIKHVQANGETVNENSGGMEGSCGAISLGENGKRSQLGTNDGQNVAGVKHSRVMGESVNEDSEGMEEGCCATSSDVQNAEDVKDVPQLMEKSL
ncbi:hypothetical protein NMG60_11016568 [Bertholletia excelsa]